jgi:hypothetical protein
MAGVVVERSENQRNNGRKKRCEVGGEGVSECFYERHKGQMKRRVLPELLHETKYRHRIVANMLLDNADEYGKLLQMELLKAGRRAASHSCKGRNDLRVRQFAAGIKPTARTWGKKATHFRPWVLKMDIIASMTVWK